jgi:ferritin
MLISKKMEGMINTQINRELYSAYLYGAMAAYFDASSWKGMAHWMKVQAKEELQHAQRFYSYIYDRGGTVILDAIEKPPSSWASPLAAFKDAYAHEQKVTGMINGIFKAAQQEDDYATQQMLQWFISEQVEEESNTLTIVQQLELIKDSVHGLFMLDSHLGKREG